MKKEQEMIKKLKQLASAYQTLQKKCKTSEEAFAAAVARSTELQSQSSENFGTLK